MENQNSDSSVSPEKGNIMIPDTNVLIHDPNAIENLMGDVNMLVILQTVILELDKLKKRPDIGIDARRVAKKIRELQKANNPRFVIGRGMEWQGLDLDHGNPDHQILAAIKKILSEKSNRKPELGKRHDSKKRNNVIKPSPYGTYDKVKFISKDNIISILASEFFSGDGLLVEDYKFDQAPSPDYKDLPMIKVKASSLSPNLTFKARKGLDIEENAGVICTCDQAIFKKGTVSSSKGDFVAIRKGDVFQVINPDISLANIKPFSMNGNGPNWEHHIAMHLLADQDIDLVFLQGGAGTGKTLLAVATAIHCREDYKKIIVARPAEHTEKDSYGFVPGDMEQKMAIWRVPIDQALAFIKEANFLPSGKKEPGQTKITEYLAKNSIPMTSLDHIRGTTFHKTLMIIDEAQNLTPHMIRTIITRAGNNTKIIFTGDLNQIDNKTLDSRSSGLAYGISKMRNQKNVGVVVFKETVRSRLAELAVRLLK